MGEIKKKIMKGKKEGKLRIQDQAENGCSVEPVSKGGKWLPPKIHLEHSLYLLPFIPNV